MEQGNQIRLPRISRLRIFEKFMKTRFLNGGLIMILVLLAATFAKTLDRGTWLMEVTPVLIGIPILIFSYRKFPLTSLLYSWIFVHSVVLIVGGFYTYAKVPFGFWIEHTFCLHRNPYDKIGHFLQGVTPALLAREIFIRGQHVSGNRMLIFLPICVAMMISACYELIEWAAALALGQGADQFLGTQGDPWDTQSDMLMALIGSISALLVFSVLQNRQIEQSKRKWQAEIAEEKFT
jgi:putative membrane protein